MIPIIQKDDNISLLNKTLNPLQKMCELYNIAFTNWNLHMWWWQLTFIERSSLPTCARISILHTADKWYQYLFFPSLCFKIFYPTKPHCYRSSQMPCSLTYQLYQCLECPLLSQLLHQANSLWSFSNTQGIWLKYRFSGLTYGNWPVCLGYSPILTFKLQQLVFMVG